MRTRRSDPARGPTFAAWLPFPSSGIGGRPSRSWTRPGESMRFVTTLRDLAGPVRLCMRCEVLGVVALVRRSAGVWLSESGGRKRLLGGELDRGGGGVVNVEKALASRRRAREVTLARGRRDRRGAPVASAGVAATSPCPGGPRNVRPAPGDVDGQAGGARGACRTGRGPNRSVGTPRCARR